ncbi:unnamed protein product [Phaeothamnion confervicola]
MNLFPLKKEINAPFQFLHNDCVREWLENERIANLFQHVITSKRRKKITE